MRRFLKSHLVLYSDWVKNHDGSPGIWRLYLFFCSRFSVRINVVWQDEPGTYHNHPWSAWSMILLGGYRETIFDDDGSILEVIDRRVGSVRFQLAEQWHRTDYLDRESPAVTLYIAGARRRVDQWRKDDGTEIDWTAEQVTGRANSEKS